MLVVAMLVVAVNVVLKCRRDSLKIPSDIYCDLVRLQTKQKTNSVAVYISKTNMNYH